MIVITYCADEQESYWKRK